MNNLQSFWCQTCKYDGHCEGCTALDQIDLTGIPLDHFQMTEKGEWKCTPYRQDPRKMQTQLAI